MCGFVAGCVWTVVFTAQVVVPSKKMLNTEQVLRVELCDFPQKTNNGAQATVRILRKDVASKAVYYGTSALLDYQPGDRLIVKAEVDDASHINHDKVATFTSQGIWLFLFAAQEERAIAEQFSTWRYLPAYLHHEAQRVIEAIFPRRTASLMHAMILGDQSALFDEDALHLSETGLYHITAVSGLHCAFLLTIVSFLIGKNREKLLAAIAIPVLILYALIVGSPPSVVRACVMLVFTLLAPIFNRESDFITALSFALFLILFADPYAIESVGLQLSFAAVFGILTITLRLNRVISGHSYPRPLQFVLQSFSVTLGATVFTLPICTLYFDSISIVAPLSNLLCLWMASAVFICGFILILIGLFFPSVASAFGVIVTCGATYIFKVSEWLSKIPHHSISLSNPYFCAWIVLAYLLLIFVFFFRKRKIIRRIVALLLPCGLIISVLLHIISFRTRPLTVAALDVGQGACTVFLTPHGAIMVDCGSGNSIKKAGYIASDYLLSAGYRTLDALYLTHFDKDHINGVEKLLSRIQVERLYLPQGDASDEEYLRILHLAAQYKIKTTVIQTPQTHTYERVLADVFPPLGSETSNEEGLSLICRFGGFEVLVTGDMNIETEEILTEYLSEDIEVLVVGHHGSVRSTSETLLDAVRPEVGIISVGANAFGHPSEKTITRLHLAGVQTHRTDEEGNITVTVDRGQKWQIKATKN